MIGEHEVVEAAEAFGVSEHQVRRDHLVSHLLVALAADPPEAGLVFFGGTALCRTHLEGWRLSEDLDLLVTGPREALAHLERTLPRAVRRDYPGLRVRAVPHDAATRVALAKADDLTVRLQLVASDAGWRRYPTARQAVQLRYSDLPATVELLVPTAAGFAAMKLAAWRDRRAARDLCDLEGLRRAGLLDDVLPTLDDLTLTPVRGDFDRPPSPEVWQQALGHQMDTPPDPVQALADVYDHFGSRLGWPARGALAIDDPAPPVAPASPHPRSAGTTDAHEHCQASLRDGRPCPYCALPGRSVCGIHLRG